MTGMPGDTTSDVDVIAGVQAEHGEGPSWDADAGALVWVDIMRGHVHRYHPDTGQDDVVDVGQPVGAAVPRAGGGLALALRDGFAVLDPGSGQMEMIALVEADNPDTRMNDGKCDSSGRFWAGTMALDARPGAGTLYRIGADHRAVKVLHGLTISNGLGWSPDDRTMYFIDTGSGGIDAFDYNASVGSLDQRRLLVTIPPEEGAPDGMAVDREGYLWVALWGGGAVHRYAPDGRRDRVIRLPVTQVTSCCFGGSALADLYITSSTYALSADELRQQPYAGRMFRYRPSVVGLPTQRFLA